MRAKTEDVCSRSAGEGNNVLSPLDFPPYKISSLVLCQRDRVAWRDFIGCCPGQAGTFIAYLEEGCFCDLLRPFQTGWYAQVSDDIFHVLIDVLLPCPFEGFFGCMKKERDYKDIDTDPCNKKGEKDFYEDRIDDPVESVTGHLHFLRQ